MNAAHAHLVINHAPLFGLIAAVLLLAWGTIRRSPDVRIAAYIAFVLSSLAAAAAYLSGVAAEPIVEDLPGVTEAAIERHQEAANIALALIAAAGVGAVIAALSERSREVLSRAAVMGVFVLAVLGLATIGYAANLGGLIHHPEITAHR